MSFSRRAPEGESGIGNLLLVQGGHGVLAGDLQLLLGVVGRMVQRLFSIWSCELEPEPEPEHKTQLENHLGPKTMAPAAPAPALPSLPG